MKKIGVLSIILFAGTLLFGQVDVDEAKELFAKLPGTWQNQVSKEFETWNQTDGNYAGKMYHIKNKDTIVTEYCKILEINGTFFYEATVMEQNNAKPIKFMLIEVTKNKLRFTNPDHDFPSTIVYEWTDENTLTAVISGFLKDGEASYSFPFKRVDQ